MEMTPEEPPPARSSSGRVNWREVAGRLRADAGTWYPVAERGHDSARVLAARLNNGNWVAGFTAADFEAVARRTSHGTTKVYARFVGAA